MVAAYIYIISNAYSCIVTFNIQCISINDFYDYIYMVNVKGLNFVLPCILQYIFLFLHIYDMEDVNLYRGDAHIFYLNEDCIMFFFLV